MWCLIVSIPDFYILTYFHLHDYVFNLAYNSDILKNVNNDKVIGVLIDNNLTWSIHMQSIAKKISSNLWLLSKLKEFFSLENRVQFYYCSTVWGGIFHSNLNRIFRLQKRAIKIILDYEYTDIASSMNELKILNIFERIFLQKAKFLYKISKSINPYYINGMFTLRTVNETLLSLRSVNTSNFQTPRPQKEIFKQSLINSGPVIWNNLPDWLKKL